MDILLVLIAQQQRIYENVIPDSSKTRLYGPVNCPTKLQCMEDKHLPLERKLNR